MRFTSFNFQNTNGLAAYVGNRAFGYLETDENYPGDLLRLISEGKAALEKAHAVLTAGHLIDLEKVEFLPPLKNPGKIICVGMNYSEHAAEAGSGQTDYPTLFTRFQSGLTAHNTSILCPKVSKELDYEGELVAVIGRQGKHIPEEEALDYVMGYSIFNDGSVRDYQLKMPLLTIGKNFDRTGAFGPSIVTADELPLGAKGLKLQTRLNGKVMQSANTNDMIFTVPRLVSLISEGITLEPGDLIVTGTPAGIGWGRKPQVWMKPGDICEVEIEKIGTLINTIVQEV